MTQTSDQAGWRLIKTLRMAFKRRLGLENTSLGPSFSAIYRLLAQVDSLLLNSLHLDPQCAQNRDSRVQKWTLMELWFLTCKCGSYDLFICGIEPRWAQRHPINFSESCLAQEMSIFGRRELWRELAQVILNEKSLWIHQNNATGLLFGRTWTSLSLLNPFRSYSGFSGGGSCGKGGGETDELWYPHRYDTVSTEFSRPDGLKLNIYQRDLPNFDVCRVSVLSRPSSDYSVAVRLLYFREYWS